MQVMKMHVQADLLSLFPIHAAKSPEESAEDAAGSLESEKASSEIKVQKDSKSKESALAISKASGSKESGSKASGEHSPGSQSRQSHGEEQAEAASKEDSVEAKPTPVVKDSLAAISGLAKRRLPMLCQARPPMLG